MIVSMVSTIILVFALYVYQRTTPVNFYLLGAFTLFESYVVGSVGRYRLFVCYGSVDGFDFSLLLDFLLMTME